MILVDNALQELEARGTPIRVGILGAGFMCQGLTNQIAHSVPGMRIVAISNRRPERALNNLRYAGFEPTGLAETQSQLDDTIRAGRPAATQDAMLLARSEQIDVLVDTTG